METVLLSYLNDYSFCPRRFAIHHIEGIWSDNAHTLTGTLLHERVDKVSFEDDGEVKTIRALPLYSKKYGITGKADVVEILDGLPVPVEYKKGRRKQWDNDDIQLCAQALCLEEMFDCKISKGYIYHASSKRRREVLFDEALRLKTEDTISSVRTLLQSGVTPKAVLKPCCEGCSLKKNCMPEVTSVRSDDKLTQYNSNLWSC